MIGGLFHFQVKTAIIAAMLHFLEGGCVKLNFNQMPVLSCEVKSYLRVVERVHEDIQRLLRSVLPFCLGENAIFRESGRRNSFTYHHQRRFSQLSTITHKIYLSAFPLEQPSELSLILRCFAFTRVI